MSARPRLLLVDDHHLMLEGLRLELESEFEIVAMLDTGGPVAEECLRLLPDVVLLDLSLPDRSGLEVIMDIRSVSPELKILVVTMHADRVLADACMQAGAVGFIPKDADVSDLIGAIRAVLAGGRYVSPLLPSHPPKHSSADMAFSLSRLTPRQQQIVRLLGDGKSTATIAAELHVSASTVTFHRVRIRKALGIPTEFALLRYALVLKLSEEGTGQG